MPDDTADIDASKAPLLDHLIELRNRLLKCVAAFVVCFGIAFTFGDKVFGFLVQPLVSAYGSGVVGKLIYTKLYEAFFVGDQGRGLCGAVHGLSDHRQPVVGLCRAGLYKREKRAFLPFIIATPILFTMGAALAYYVVMPVAFKFFLGFQSSSRSHRHHPGSAAGDGRISRSGDEHDPGLRRRRSCCRCC